MSITAASIAGKIGQAALTELIKQVRVDRKNRYILNADFTLPLLVDPMPLFEDEALLIDGKTVTIKAFDGPDDCDGNTLSPDKWRGKLLFAFIPHDRIYSRLCAIAEAWGVTIPDVRLWADGLYYSIMDAQGVPRWVSWAYYQGIRYGGKAWRGRCGSVVRALLRLLSVAVVAAIVAGCDGCATPPENFFEDPDSLTEPDVTKTAAMTRQEGSGHAFDRRAIPAG